MAEIPGGGCLQLVSYGRDFEILVGTEQLMGSWAGGSEEALATLVCQRLGARDGRWLIGGLGMGFTLAAALAVLPRRAEVVVAELVPKVVSWALGPLAHIFGDTLSDPRVSLKIRDVHDLIVEQPDSFDAILLDVDNGPDGLVSPANDRLYCNWGLRAAHAALRPGGMLAVWSAYPDADFLGRLEDAGFKVEEIRMDAESREDDFQYVIWLACRPG